MMDLRNRVITGIVLICSLMLLSCAFPVRPGYDRKSGSYKRYRVPKQEIVENDTTTINSQEELVQEEILAAASKNTGNNIGMRDTSETTTQDSTNAANSKTSNLTTRDSSVIKTTTAQKQDSTKVQKNDTTRTANRTAKITEKQIEKAAAKKAEKIVKKQTKPAAKPTNLEKYAKEWLGAKYVYGAASKKKTDCSGYVMQVYKGFYGIALDHNAQRIFDDGRGYSIKRKKLQEGDLVFFGNFFKTPIGGEK